jgi:CRISPR/Cas system-associated exonuclease Cas4 (RecB family)
VPTTPAPVLVESPHARERVGAAIDFATRAGGRVFVVGATREAAADIVRKAALARGSAVGLEAHTLKSLAGVLSRRALAKTGAVPCGMLTLEALVQRIIMTERELGRFAALRNEPGLARALTRTLTELRLEDIERAKIADETLKNLLACFERDLSSHGFADPAMVFAAARENAGTRGESALLLLDVSCMHRAQAAFVEALTKTATETLATIPLGDARTLSLTGHLSAPVRRTKESPSAVERVQSHLFSESHAGLRHDEGITIFSAPGESREAAEIARRVLALAKSGVPFDDMAVLLRNPREYALALEEAFARARIPGHFARGTKRPDPSGRAFLALLACADDGLSAARFSEYLSLGELPDADASGVPPPAWPAPDRWVPPDDETVAGATATPEPAEHERDPEAAAGGENDAAPVVAGSIRAPKLWERLLVDAAVIGGLDRWKKRLVGLRNKLASDLKELEGDDARMATKTRDIRALDAMRVFALPLLAELDALGKAPRSLAEWVRDLSALATRALRRPERVLSVLSELAPVGHGAKVDMSEVRLVLEPRLTDLTVKDGGARYGRVYVAAIDEARGMAFRHVFVPGLVERGFPQKLAEDPMFLDRGRSATHPLLVTNEQRLGAERLALRIAIGAASEHAVFSYPRVDTELGRPKTPSFYALEIVRAQTGGLSGFEELADRADVAARARIGWPAPLDPKDAIDESEHDLALLARVLDKPENETVGTARYLLSSNPHLARALRFRAKRWLRTFSEADGLVDPPPAVKEILAEHALGKRSFSPTALQNFASCPYRFFLYAVHKLSPREEPEAIEEMDALQKGSFVHDVLFEFLTELRDAKLLPITAGSLDAARAQLDGVLERVDKRYKEDLFPAIDRVWADGIAQIRADLREWLRRESESEDGGFVPAFFELSFGLEGQRDASDASSSKEPIQLDCGIKLRGSIDLVEQEGNTLRATDYKTGKKRADDGAIIGGGKILQPVLYALVLEKMFPQKQVSGGRLYYATSTGGFTPVMVELNEAAREGAKAVAEAVGKAIDDGFLPALPDERECTYCDYKPVCGPYEEVRTKKKKPHARSEALVALRKRP